ncbi:MAG: Protein of unknown function transrane [Verrucomicrobia bacterium]|nr:Protein of unknown function transrane [Verrucomicrobiota bacterium]
MKPSAQAELMHLRDDYEHIRRQVERLGFRLDTFEQELLTEQRGEAVGATGPDRTPVQPPPLPDLPLMPFPPMAGSSATVEAASIPPEQLSAPPPSVEGVSARSANLEMKLATYWFVRLGVVLLLTGLAFFGYFTYQHVIPQLNQWGKLGAISLMGALLIGGGLWCERRADNEKLQTFGRIIFGGGLATLYFMLYAAHHIPHLQVVPSATVDGLLLFGWAGLIVWLADRRRSEVLALFAIGMSYYTSAVSQLGVFTLVSNLILTIASVVFLVRHRWAVLSLASMVATYIGYGFWRFYHSMEWLTGPGGDQLWLGVACLAGCWLVLTVGAFTRRTPGLDATTRAAMLVLNNSFFYGSAALTFVQFHRESFWWVSLAFGGICTALSAVANRKLSDESIVRQWLLGQGVLFVTIGIIEHFSGVHLGLILCVEALALMLAGQAMNLRLLRAAAYVVGFIGTFSAWSGIELNNWAAGMEALGAGLVLAATGWFVRRYRADEDWLATKVTLWSGAALLLWFEIICHNVDEIHRPLVLSLAALLLALALPLHRLKPLATWGQGYLIVAQGMWLTDTQMFFPAWTIAVLIVITFALAQWWQRQETVNEEGRTLTLSLLAMMALFLGLHWLAREWVLDQRILVTALIGVLVVAYGALTRWWALTVIGQIIIAYLGVQFLQGMGRVDDMRNLVPVLTFALFGGALRIWSASNGQKDTRDRFDWLANTYHLLAALMTIVWIHQYVGHLQHVWMQMALGLGMFLIGWKFQRQGALLLAVLFAGVAFFDFWLQKGAPHVYWANLLAILTPLVVQQMLRRSRERFEVEERWHLMLTVISGVSVWLYVSEWAANRMLTASWTALAFAFLAGGLVVKERAWRWLGLVMLTCAIGRAIFMDVWKLGVLYRVLSFMALGIALIVLGYIYTRYQEKIKKWL